MTTPPTPTRRRNPLRVILLSVLAVTLICCGGAVALGTWVLTSGTTDTFDKIEFANRLAIPPLAPSQIDAKGRRVFELAAKPGTHDFGAGRRVDTWGFNGAYLGPTLRATRGEQVVVNVRNGLDVDTSVHWHGMHLPAAMDGGPHQPVRAGGNWAPTWKVDQPAATLWYHPHPHGETAKHVYRGLAGMFIVDDEKSPPLPNRYGVDDIPVIVQDKKFSREGDELDDAPGFLSGIGILGDEIAVNGTLAPYLDVTTDKVRLRVLNGSTARSYNFGFSDDRPFALIATDGGLLERPVRTERLNLSPGERAEIVVDVRPGEQTVLRSYPPEVGNDLLRTRGGNDRFDVLQLRAAGQLEQTPALPQQLSTMERLDPATAAVTRRFKLSGHNINGEQMEMDRIDHVSTVDTNEVWEVVNSDGDFHSFHVHDVQFQILAVDGSKPPAHLSGWKDTIPVQDGRSYKLIMRFADYSDPNTPYMYHCHVLFHEDAGMMGQFVVVKPGEQAGRPISKSHQH
ncbi:multicopper oxidase family protein [Allorhizocola rhizosphaerae]|uniref:multicopper oxidase family protein n=1 Tax=Allorhizocola rhizosphaerae TaxID=1872709 RepID=UPI001FE7C93E|nr:multicopper oxidase domain-containing protein [Allorhizocola rhizosphaerae]